MSDLERRGIDSRVVRRRYRVPLQPGVGKETVGPGHADHEIPSAAVRRLPGLQHDRVNQAGFVQASKRSTNAPLRLCR